ncbi:hypothetical protein B0H21DRAFT_825129 [Amylocystis lapponica]|nr:hypothetical protein B0H21DRAFT_825129 [Amylocystis lapponica]
MNAVPNSVQQRDPDAGGSVLLATLDASRRVSSERARLSQEGYTLLREFVASHELPPTREQREAFLTRLRALPGCDNYKMQSLTSYINRKRLAARGARDRSAGTPLSSHDILYPSLNQDAMEKLEILLNETQFPSLEVVKIWASRLKVNYRDVTTWINLKHASSRKEGDSLQITEDYVSSLGASHLPTPECSTSPEPPFLSKYKYDPEGTPHAPTAREQSVLSPDTTKKRFANHKVKDPSSTLSVEQLKDLGEQLRTVLTKEKNKLLDEVKPPPTSAEEFSRWFDPHEEKMLRFLKKVNNGAYTKWGFEPHPDLDQAMAVDQDIDSQDEDPPGGFE